jgi:hypothetical protein
MPSGTVAYNTFATTYVSDEQTWHWVALDPARLVDGKNVLAVEVHQANLTSSDLIFDAELTGTSSIGDVTPPPPDPEPTPTAPTAPASLTATAVSSSRVDLAWADRSDDESGFKIERASAGSSSFQQVGTVTAGVTRYSDTGVAAGAAYVYRVRAYNAAGSSAYTATAPATTPSATDGGSDSVAYTGPIVITRGGTYTGNWQSLDAGTSAVTIKTTEPVVIENANVRSRGDLISTGVSGTNVTVRNTRGYALNPEVAGQTPGRFFDGEYFKNVVLRNNYLEGTGGIRLLEYRGNFTTDQTVKVVGNVALNIDGRKSDGNGGYLDFDKRTRISDGVEESGYKIRQFVQFDKVANVPGIEVAWNQVINEPGKSRVEDVINVYKSSGTATSPIRIHDNYIQGAYNVKPWQASYSDGTWEYDYGYEGGGIMLGDGSSGVAYVHAYDNQVVSTTNYGIAIAAGHDSVFYDNRILSSGRLPDGRRIADQNVGAYIWDLYKAGSSGFYNNSGRDNLIGWVKGGGRNDWWIPDATSFTNNTRWPGEVTTATEAAELTRWRDKLTSSGVRTGPAN